MGKKSSKSVMKFSEDMAKVLGKFAKITLFISPNPLQLPL